MIIGGLLGNLLRSPRRKWDGFPKTHSLGLEAIMLDGVELFAYGARMLLATVPGPLEIGAVVLGPFGQAFVQQGFDAVAVQGVFVVYFCLAIVFDAFELS